VVLGDRVVVHVSDDHRLRVAGARSVVSASYLATKQSVSKLETVMELSLSITRKRHMS
jgi:hypothetical protein